MPKIQIEQQAARIGINSSKAKVEVNYTPRPKMHIIKEAPHMEIERKAPAFKVEPPRRRPLRMPAEQTAAPGLTGRARTPRRLAADITVEAGENQELKPFNAAPLELNKALNDYAGAINSDIIPQSMPDIEWEAGYLNITWTKAQMQIEWDQEDYMPSFSVEPHAVEIYLREKPYIKITVSDEVIAAMHGRQMDEEV